MALANNIRLIGYCGAMPDVTTTEQGMLIAKVPIYTTHWLGKHADGRAKKYTEIQKC